MYRIIFVLASICQIYSLIHTSRSKSSNIKPCHKLYNSPAQSDNGGFDTFGFPEWLVNRCNELGFTQPTEVQTMGFPSIMDGKDVILQAQTGSGKTLLFCLPVLSKVDPQRAAIQAVIVVPTRELGLQVASTFKVFSKGSPTKISIMSVMEGSNNRRQQLWATAEPPHIIIGNPKSLQKIVDMGRLRLNSVSMVVIDEVDACLLNTDTKHDLHKLLSRRLSNSYQNIEDIIEKEMMSSSFNENLVYTDLTKRDRQNQNDIIYRNDRQTIFCSATIPQRKHFVQICYKNGWTQTEAELIHVTPESLVPTQVKHEIIDVSSSTTTSTTTNSATTSSTKSKTNTASSDSDENEGSDEEEIIEKKIALIKYILKQNIKKYETNAADTDNMNDDHNQVPNHKIVQINYGNTATDFMNMNLYQTIIFVDTSEDATNILTALKKPLASLYDNSKSSKSSSTAGSSVSLLSQQKGLNQQSSTSTSSSSSSSYFKNRLSAKRSGGKMIPTTTTTTTSSSSAADSDIPADSSAETDMHTHIHTENIPPQQRQQQQPQQQQNEDWKEKYIMILDESLNIEQRAHALDYYRQGICRILICTDVASRGIDVPDTSLVIQWSLPRTFEQYVHRSGRTGRLGRPGQVVTFTTNEQDFVIKRYSNELGVPIKKRKIQISSKSSTTTS